jgi:hypothetical protein
VILRYPDNEILEYSEATTITQGSYALKAVAPMTTTLNNALTRIITSPINLSNKTAITFDLRSSRTGANIKLGFHDSGGTTSEITPTIVSANTFQSVSFDISGVSNVNKDAIDKIIITIMNADAANTFYVDNILGVNPSLTSWVSSDSIATPISIDTSVKMEGYGSVKTTTTVASAATLDNMEYASDADAQTAYPQSLPTGGTITVVGGYRIHTFTSSGTWTNVTYGPTTIEALVVGGGGGGYNGTTVGGGGGGGAGGVLYSSGMSVSATDYSVTVGAKGGINTNGNNSVFNGLTAYGGGAPNNAGGSGGGARNANYTYGAGTAGQGYHGGSGVDGVYTGGPGGGAGAAGANSTSNSPAAGGVGLQYSISGTATYYGGGGGACWYKPGYAGGLAADGAGTIGGGGHGGSSWNCGEAGTGQDGIVILRYPDNRILQYSESSIKTQGSYSLKGVAPITTSLNNSITRTLTTPLDLSNKTAITFDLRSSRTGANIKLGFHDSGGTTSEITPTIVSANTFQSVSFDISGVSNVNKDAIDKIIITIMNADAANTFYVDNIQTTQKSSLNDTISLTTAATNLSSHQNISLWVRSTIAGQTMRFQFGETDSSEQTYDITITSANTWEQKVWDISGISSTARDAVTKYAFKVANASVSQTFYFDDVYANLGVNQPTSLLTEGLVNPVVNTYNPNFTAIHNDPDNQTAIYYRIQVNTASDFSGTTMWDSGKTSIAAVPSGSRSSNITYAGSTLQCHRTTYYWRIMFWDDEGTSSAWSDYQTFMIQTPPDTPSLDHPTDTQVNAPLFVSFKTTASDEDSDYLRYKILVCTDNAMMTGCQTLDQTTNQSGWMNQDSQSNTAYSSGTQATYTSPTAFAQGTTYYWKTYAIDPAGTNSWSTTQTTPYSFTTITIPSTPQSCIGLIKSADNTTIQLQWSDPLADQHVFEISKSIDSGTFNLLTTTAIGATQYLDTIASGHSYGYRIRGRITDSDGNYVYSTDYCTTNTANVQTGTVGISGLKLKGLQLH